MNHEVTIKLLREAWLRCSGDTLGELIVRVLTAADPGHYKVPDSGTVFYASKDWFTRGVAKLATSAAPGKVSAERRDEITRVTEALLEAWMRHPHWRLPQLMMVAIGNPQRLQTFIYMPDSAWEEELGSMARLR